MHPRAQLGRQSHRSALIMAGSGARLSFAELDQAANRWAHLLRGLGLRTGDRVALWMENDPRFFSLCWAAHNSGLFYVPISARLTGDEATFIADDSGAKLVVVGAGVDSADFAPALATLQAIDDPELVSALAAMPDTPPADEQRGAAMLYSSGTTGAPKGVVPNREPVEVTVPTAVTETLVRLYGFDENTVYLSTAPFYHAAPLKFVMAVQAAGGTVVAMEQFGAEAALAAIEQYGVTHSQWVPTMFIRLLNLPEAVRKRYDLSTHKLVIHAAAPCPVPIKERMLAWWGPIIHEYYGGSESVGMTAIGPDTWLAKKGSVGRAVRGAVRIVGDDGRLRGPSETGLVCFDGCTAFRYHGAAASLAPSLPDGLGTFGDIGHVDADGYLYLTDRRDDVINVGGVNVYPQEAEQRLAAHPKVGDVAVFGIPHPEWGEEVKAVVQPARGIDATPALADELIAYCRAHLSSIKCPRSIEFAAKLPREETGKLLKRVLKSRYRVNPGRAGEEVHPT